MTGVAMPDKRRLPPGPRREFTTALHALYVAAGKPGTRTISNAIRDRDDLPATLSHEAVRQLLAGERGSWRKVESLVRLLAEWSVDRPGVPEILKEIHALWLAADGGPPESHLQPADPALLRLAIRGLHGPTDRDAVEWFLRSRLYLPVAPDQGFLVATTSDGLWICVFTSLDRLHAHQRATQPRWAGDWTETLGRDLIRQVCRLQLPVGLLLDPATAPGADVTETLPLPHTLIAEIADLR
jgi:SseB protein N-terminal domain